MPPHNINVHVAATQAERPQPSRCMPQHGAPTGDRQWGRLPNVYRHAPSMQAIRDQPAFEALPPVASVCVAGPDSHRYVRQDDPLWDRLHEGVLTTGWSPCMVRVGCQASAAWPGQAAGTEPGGVSPRVQAWSEGR
jgi:hypothetical protein